jgi:hypothetical protein
MTPPLSKLFLPLACLLTAPSAHADHTIQGEPRVSFQARGRPGALSILGKTTALTLAEDGQRLLFTVPMGRVTTGIELRDRHMLDQYVEVARFPEVSLVLERASLALPAEEGERAKGTLVGRFTARGIERDVPVSWSAKRRGGGWDIEASFSFDVREHGIQIPTYMGVTVDSVMKAEASLHVVGP